jgi:twitching motility protein PilT
MRPRLAATGAGRHPAVEMMLANSAIRNLIRHGGDYHLRADIETGPTEGMLATEQSLADNRWLN